MVINEEKQQIQLHLFLILKSPPLWWAFFTSGPQLNTTINLMSPIINIKENLTSKYIIIRRKLIIVIYSNIIDENELGRNK
jgi:hypothetical protein